MNGKNLMLIAVVALALVASPVMAVTMDATATTNTNGPDASTAELTAEASSNYTLTNATVNIQNKTGGTVEGTNATVDSVIVNGTEYSASRNGSEIQLANSTNVSKGDVLEFTLGNISYNGTGVYAISITAGNETYQDDFIVGSLPNATYSTDLSGVSDVENGTLEVDPATSTMVLTVNTSGNQTEIQFDDDFVELTGNVEVESNGTVIYPQSPSDNETAFEATVDHSDGEQIEITVRNMDFNETVLDNAIRMTGGTTATFDVVVEQPGGGATATALPVPSIFTDTFGGDFGAAVFWTIAVAAILETFLAAYLLFDGGYIDRVGRKESISLGFGVAGFMALLGSLGGLLGIAVVLYFILITIAVGYLYTKQEQFATGSYTFN